MTGGVKGYTVPGPWALHKGHLSSHCLAQNLSPTHICTHTHTCTHTLIHAPLSHDLRLLEGLTSVALGEEPLVLFVINCCVLILVSEGLPFTEEEMRLVLNSIV